MYLLHIFLDEQVAAFSGFEEAQIKRELCAGTLCLELIEQLLVIDRLRSFRKRTFLIDIFDPARQRIGGHLALVEAAQRLDLARQPVRGREYRSLAQKI